MSDHAWVQENLSAYITGGLSADERERLEKHVADCPACAQSLAESRKLEQVMEDLFAPTRPDTGLEDRAIKKLREKPARRPLSWPVIVRVAACIVAVPMLGLLGAALQVFGGGDLPGIGAKESTRQTAAKAQSVNNLKQLPAFHSPPTLIDESRSMLQWRSEDEGRQFTERGDRYSSVAPHGDATVKKPKLDDAEGKLGGEHNGSAAALKILLDDLHKEQRHLQQMTQADPSKVEKHLEEAARLINQRGLASIIKPSVPTVPTPSPILADKDKEKWKEGLDFGLRIEEDKRRISTEKYYRGGGQELTKGEDGRVGGRIQFAPSFVSPKMEWATPNTPLPGTSPPAPAPVANPPRLPVKAEPLPELGMLVLRPKEEQKPPTPEEPLPLDRKIIRTGEMEFEIDSFAAASKAITQLAESIKGAFVATSNSEKLPNGKVRGSIVVRVPPARLNTFINELQGALGKSAELKHQKIASQEVTKQYIDIESRLRAARSIEKRLLDIIEKGKGEVKDLIAAERELGVWRTKIEEMEGEIRYYNNQIALSTLTLTLVEKEIQAPSALVLTERVRMRIETDDVEKSHKAALDAVAAVKGRVIKSELKQYTLGQLEAIVHAEVKPEARDTFRDLLKKLGIIAHQDAERLQKTEGGSGPVQELKPRQSDVQFEISLYNVANIQPRETFTLQLATTDVSANYHKLRDAVTQAKGQIRTGQLNEQDRRNVVAQLDFDILTQDRSAIEKLIDAVGPVFSRSTGQAPANEIATDRKIGYRLTIRNVGNIPPRETVTMTIEVKDVDLKSAHMKELVAASKGRDAGSRINYEPNGQVTASLVFDVPLAAQEALLRQFKDQGTIRQQQSTRNPSVPDNELATAHFEVTLTSAGPIVVQPRETITLHIATLDVASHYRRLQDAVAALKGQVRTGQLNEQDKRNVTAQFDFDILTQDRQIIDKLIDTAGPIFSRSTTQAAASESATDRKLGYKLTLRNVANIPPREKVTLTIEVQDVDEKAIEMQDLVRASKGLVAGSRINHEPSGQVTAALVFDVPLAAQDALVRQFKEKGKIRQQQSIRNPQVPDNELATAHLEVTLTSAPLIVPSDDGLWPPIRTGLYLSFKFFSIAIVCIITGFSVLLPSALGLWALIKLMAWLFRSKPQTPTAS